MQYSAEVEVTDFIPAAEIPFQDRRPPKIQKTDRNSNVRLKISALYSQISPFKTPEIHPSLTYPGDRATNYILNKEEKKSLNNTGGTIGKFLQDVIELAKQGFLQEI